LPKLSIIRSLWKAEALDTLIMISVSHTVRPALQLDVAVVVMAVVTKSNKYSPAELPMQRPLLLSHAQVLMSLFKHIIAVGGWSARLARLQSQMSQAASLDQVREVAAETERVMREEHSDWFGIAVSMTWS
jgi:hypothetical protein